VSGEIVEETKKSVEPEKRTAGLGGEKMGSNWFLGGEKLYKKSTGISRTKNGPRIWGVTASKTRS